MTICKWIKFRDKFYNTHKSNNRSKTNKKRIGYCTWYHTGIKEGQEKRIRRNINKRSLKVIQKNTVSYDNEEEETGNISSKFKVD